MKFTTTTTSGFLEAKVGSDRTAALRAAASETYGDQCGIRWEARSGIHTHVHRASSRSSTPTAKMPYRSESMIVFAAREAKKMWPFLAGFAVVGFGVTQATLGITEADKKKSAFLNPGGHH